MEKVIDELKKERKKEMKEIRGSHLDVRQPL